MMRLNIRQIDGKNWVLLMVLLSLLGTQLWQIMKETKFATVDAQYIINSEAQKLAKLYPKGDVPELKLQQLVSRFKDVVEEYAQMKRVIIISKGALMGGTLPDYTQIIQEKLKEMDENP